MTDEVMLSSAWIVDVHKECLPPLSFYTLLVAHRGSVGSLPSCISLPNTDGMEDEVASVTVHSAA